MRTPGGDLKEKMYLTEVYNREGCCRGQPLIGSRCDEQSNRRLSGLLLLEPLLGGSINLDGKDWRRQSLRNKAEWWKVMEAA